MKRVSTFFLYAAAAALFQVATAPGVFAAPISFDGIGSAANFAVLGGQEVTNTGPTTLGGDLGVSPGTSLTGTETITLSGSVHNNDGVAGLAQSDATTAYDALAALSSDSDLTGFNLGGMTLTSGVYSFSSEAQLTGALTLDFQGNDNEDIVFQIGSKLTTASNSSVLLTNANSTNHVYWQVGSSATLGTTTSFAGTIIALTSVTMNTGATDGCGSIIARNGTVTLDSNVISTTCAITGPGPGEEEEGTVTPTPGEVHPVPEPGTLLLMGTGIVGLVARRRRSARA